MVQVEREKSFIINEIKVATYTHPLPLSGWRRWFFSFSFILLGSFHMLFLRNFFSSSWGFVSYIYTNVCVVRSRCVVFFCCFSGKQVVKFAAIFIKDWLKQFYLFTDDGIFNLKCVCVWVCECQYVWINREKSRVRTSFLLQTFQIPKHQDDNAHQAEPTTGANSVLREREVERDKKSA